MGSHDDAGHACGEQAEELIGNGVSLPGQSQELIGGLAEYGNPIVYPHVQICDVDHALVHADPSHDGSLDVPLGGVYRYVGTGQSAEEPVGIAHRQGGNGTVTGVDDAGSIHVRWDIGSSLAVVYGEDACKKLDAI